MDCAKVRELIEAMIDGRLPPREAAEVREHVEGCPSCAAEEASLRRVGTLLRLWTSARAVERSAGLDVLWTRVAAEIEERRGGRRRSAIARKWLWIPAAAALAVFTLLFYSPDGARAPFRPTSFDVSVESLESDTATLALVDKGEDLPRVIWIIEDGKS